MANRASRVLLLGSREGFLARQVAGCLDAMGVEWALFRTDTHELLGGPDVSDLSFPAWGDDVDPEVYNREYRAAFAEMNGRWKPELLIAIGVDGALIGATKSELPLVVLYGPPDISFSRKRERLLRRFQLIAERTRAFVCLDSLVAHDLIDKGSRVPHFLWKPPSFEDRSQSEPPALERVVVFSETRHRRPALASEQVATMEASAGRSWSLFGCDHGRSNRPRKSTHLEDVELESMTAGLEGTICVLLGESNEHGATAAAAIMAGSPVFMEDKLHNHLLAARLPGVVVFDKSRLVAELPAAVADWKQSGASAKRGSFRPDCCPWLDLEYLESVPWFYDELDEDRIGDLVVYASVSGFPRVRDRARAVRTQAILHELRARYTTVMLQPHSPYVERRRLQLESLAPERRPKLVYIESGTSPVKSGFREGFFGLLGDLRSAGARIGWFARDAHYLSADFGMDEEYRQGLLDAARPEAESVERVAHRLYAPTTRLFEHFVDSGLYGQDSRDRFMPLPPGTDPRLRRSAAVI
ncbi:MAG: hypothetical protein KJO07_13755, partial [Deltaproteobacteria bacterium]|nr:hypothetical protein [Deltaproteobacteria bacterium]